MKRNCDQCQAMMINGVFCHEHGCPNTHRGQFCDHEEGNLADPEPEYDYLDEQLDRYECSACGYPHRPWKLQSRRLATDEPAGTRRN